MADRSVTVRLDADVRPFVTAMAKAEAAAKSLRDSLGKAASIHVNADTSTAQAQIQSLQREVDRLNGTRATVRAEVDAAQAQAQVAELRRRMEELSSRRIGVDLDAGAARSALSSIQRDLERLNSTSADPKVRVDSAAALAQLRAVQSQMSSVSGKSARVKVDADIGGALAGIATVAAALAALPAAVSIGVGVAGLGAAFGVAAVGAAGFAAVAIPGLSRVNEALKQAETASGGAGGAMKSAGQKAAEAASSALRLAEAQDRVKDSAQAVRSAQQAVRDAMAGVRSAQQDAARAAEDAADRQVQAAARIADSERSVQDAHRATQRAIEDLTRAREAARERIEDLALATERGALSEERAQLSIKRAQAELARIGASNASPLDKEDAALRLREAELALKEIQERNGDLAKEREDSDKKGVEGSDEVVAAKERILDAQRAEADAERSLAAARAESARVARDGAREVADAQSKIAEAQRKVADAQRDVIKAQRDHLRAVQALKVEQLQQAAATEKVGSSSGGAATKMAQLSKAERELAKDIKAFQKEYLDWQRSLQPDVFPVIEKGLDVLRVGMDRATPLVKGGAKGLGEFADAAKKALESKEWTDFFDDLGQRAPDAIAGLGRSTINVAGGLRGVVEAFLPYTGPITDWVEDITQDFEDWGTSLKGSDGFKEFLAYAAEQGPKVAEVLGNIATFAGKVVKVGADVGPGVLDFLVGLSEKLAALDPGQIEAVAKGVGLIFAAMKLGASLKIAGLVLLAEVLGKMSPGQIQALAIAIGTVVAATKGFQAVSGAVDFFQNLSGSIDKTGKSAGGAHGKLSSLAGLIGKGGVIAAAAAGTVLAVDGITDSLDGLNPNLDEVAKGLSDFGRGAEPTGALLDQLGPKVQSTIGHFESFADSAARLASDNPLAKIADGFTGFIDSSFGVQLDAGRQSIDNVDKSLAAMVANGNAEGAAGAFNRLARQALDAGVPVERLKELFPQYAASMDGIPATTGEVGSAIETLGGHVNGTQKALGEAAQRMTDWKTSLDAFNSQTDAAATVREMEKAFADTKIAIENANGKLELTPGLTAKQRDAVIQARDAFSGYLEKVRASNDAQATLTGRTTEARDAMVKQLPALFDLAGKNGAARDQVLKLAAAYGISETDAHKAARGGQDLLEVLAKLKSKDIHVGADVKPAQEAIDNFVRLNSGRKIPLSVYTKNSQLAAGAIMRYAEGGLQRFAEGGRATPAPHIASTPTILYGEGRAPEAFIPYDPAYRERATALLGQVAGDFGLQVFNAQAGKQVDSLTGTLKETQYNVSSSLSQATSMLSSTLGDAGTLTSTVATVGTLGSQVAQSWTSGSKVIGESVTAGSKTVGDSVTGMSSAVTAGSEKVVKATDVLKEAALRVAEAVSKAAGGSGKGSQGSTNVPAPGGGTGKGSQGSVIPPAPPKPQALTLGADSVAGMYGVAAPTYSQMTNSSRVSAPQQAPSSWSPASSTGSAGSSAATPGSVVNNNVTFPDLVVRETADASVLFAQASMFVASRG